MVIVGPYHESLRLALKIRKWRPWERSPGMKERTLEEKSWSEENWQEEEGLWPERFYPVSNFRLKLRMRQDGCKIYR